MGSSRRKACASNVSSASRSPEALSDLIPDPRNANKGTARGKQALYASLRELGAGRSILVDRAGRVIAGNKTADQARALGLPLKVVRTDGHELVAVLRTDLDLATDARATQLAIADNRVNELDLEWNAEVLCQLQADGVDVSDFWSDMEFAKLIGESGRGDAEEDRVIEPPPTTIRTGDLFKLGRHRLLCGDATSPTDVARVCEGDTPRLMVTDPPYGVNYDPAWRHRARPHQRTAVGRVTNDDRADWTAAWKLFTGPVAYVWHAALKAGAVAADLEGAGFDIRSQIVWVKQHFALGRGDYHWQHEPCWYAVRRGAKAHWCGDRSQSTVWEIPNLNPMGGSRTDDDAVTGHGTQKPVKLFERAMRNHVTGGDVVYDPFAGSGTAVIAAEKVGCTCLALELEPRYVQAIVDRWETYTGQTANRLSRAGGRR